MLTFLIEINILKIERYKLDIDPIAFVYWIEDEEIFVNEIDRVYIYNIEEREIIDEYEKTENHLWGYDKELLLCTWENVDIDSPDEFSTHLTIANKDNVEILNTQLHPTVEVVRCTNPPILKTVFPIEEKYYYFDDDLYELQTYEVNTLSPDFRKMLNMDDLGNYWITKFSIF